MDDTVRPDQVVIQLDVELYRELFEAVGCKSDAAIARFTGVTPRTIRRARKGILGEVFMAHTVAALRRRAETLSKAGYDAPTLDRLFTVVDMAA